MCVNVWCPAGDVDLKSCRTLGDGPLWLCFVEEQKPPLRSFKPRANHSLFCLLLSCSPSKGASSVFIEQHVNTWCGEREANLVLKNPLPEFYKGCSHSIDPDHHSKPETNYLPKPTCFFQHSWWLFSTLLLTRNNIIFNYPPPHTHTNCSEP